jgi:hypothetical protein
LFDLLALSWNIIVQTVIFEFTFRKMAVQLSNVHRVQIVLVPNLCSIWCSNTTCTIIVNCVQWSCGYFFRLFLKVYDYVTFVYIIIYPVFIHVTIIVHYVCSYLTVLSAHCSLCIHLLEYFYINNKIKCLLINDRFHWFFIGFINLCKISVFLLVSVHKSE